MATLHKGGNNVIIKIIQRTKKTQELDIEAP